jgi:hypothetical protein
MSAARLTSLRTKELSSRTVDSFSVSDSLVAPRVRRAASSQATLFGPMGGPPMGTRSAHRCRR